jgi:hypothetical protein
VTSPRPGQSVPIGLRDLGAAAIHRRESFADGSRLR